LIEGGEPQAGLLPNVELFDVRRRNLGLDRQLVSVRHDQHQGIGRAHHAADRVYAELMNDAVLRCADIHALELIIRGDLSLDKLADLAVDLA
jgi:hypothetical protein